MLHTLITRLHGRAFKATSSFRLVAWLTRKRHFNDASLNLPLKLSLSLHLQQARSYSGGRDSLKISNLLHANRVILTLSHSSHIYIAPFVPSYSINLVLHSPSISHTWENSIQAISKYCSATINKQFDLPLRPRLALKLHYDMSMYIINGFARNLESTTSISRTYGLKASQLTVLQNCCLVRDTTIRYCFYTLVLFLLHNELLQYEYSS